LIAIASNIALEAIEVLVISKSIELVKINPQVNLVLR